jgi:cytochrome c biogenesis protein CcdA
MLELFKLIVDGVMLRDSARKGLLTWKVVLFAIGFVVLLYGTGVPASLLYDTHPQYKPLFIAAIVFDVLMFVLFMIFGTRWYLRATARLKAQSTSADQTLDS